MQDLPPPAATSRLLVSSHRTQRSLGPFNRVQVGFPSPPYLPLCQVYLLSM